MTTVVPSVTIVRRVKAAPERVFDAWTRPEALARWFGPHHTRVDSAETDARQDGGFTIRLIENNGDWHQVSGRYTEFDPPRLLAFTWTWVATPERESRVTVSLRPVPEGTEVTLVHDRFADDVTATNHRRGWTESMERLAGFFTEADAA